MVISYAITLFVAGATTVMDMLSLAVTAKKAKTSIAFGAVVTIFSICAYIINRKEQVINDLISTTVSSVLIALVALLAIIRAIYTYKAHRAS